MEIIIEIGTDEQKLLIEQELRTIELVANEIKPPVELKQIIVPSNFQAKINNLESIDTYKSTRGLGVTSIDVVGRIVKLKDGFGIVLAPSLYTEHHDSQTRLFITLHEFYHLINKRDFLPIPSDPYVTSLYSHNLYCLYDEYSSDRFAFGMVDELFPVKSDYWNAFLTTDVQGFIEIITDLGYYNHIRAEISAFRNHANVDLFFKNTQHHFDEMAITLTHTFSLAHHHPDKISHETLLKSIFVNDKTVALMDYFRTKTERRESNLDDGMKLIIAFMENFGVRFEQRDYGGYCHILDI
jgi:acyl carrier protein